MKTNGRGMKTKGGVKINELTKKPKFRHNSEAGRLIKEASNKLESKLSDLKQKFNEEMFYGTK